MTEEEKEIQTSHFKTIDELIQTCKMWIKDDDYDAYCRFFEFDCMKELINLIQKQQEELKKKDKEIDLLTKFVENNISEKKLINEICIKGKCVNEECHEDDIKECVKQYFEKQVEKE